MKYSQLEIGMSFSSIEFVSTAYVEQFAKLSGDFNPIHTDLEFCKKSIFERPIIHGMIVGALFSKVIANDFPGPGSIYLHQDLNFLKPIFHNSNLEVKVEVKSLKPEKKIVVLSTLCLVSEILVVEGKAIVKCLD